MLKVILWTLEVCMFLIMAGFTVYYQTSPYFKISLSVIIGVAILLMAFLVNSFFIMRSIFKEYGKPEQRYY